MNSTGWQSHYTERGVYGARDVRDSTTVTNNGRHGGVITVEPFGRLKVGGVQILRAMGEEVEA
jgi:hypothetical protein